MRKYLKIPVIILLLLLFSILSFYIIFKEEKSKEEIILENFIKENLREEYLPSRLNVIHKLTSKAVPPSFDINEYREGYPSEIVHPVIYLGKGDYSWLETLISKYLIEADENSWVISDDEISYYFALGLNFGRVFKGGE